MTKFYEYKTQKVKGLRWLSTQAVHLCNMRSPGLFYGANFYPSGNRIHVFPHHEPILPSFARPCPLTPRHGFVESRLVTTQWDLAGIVKETYSVDPQAEIIFMPKLSGAYSGVATPSLCTIGGGNDGATGGHKVLARIPTPIPDVIKNWNYLTSGVPQFFDDPACLKPNEDVVYVEAVEDEGYMVAVQARQGPRLDGFTDYIPKAMTVERVFALGGDTEEEVPIDLLAWEEQVRDMRKSGEAVVVWAKGSSLSSHYAVHCIQNKIPFLTGETPPNVGDKLEAKAPPKTTNWGRERFAKEMLRRLEGKIYGEENIDEGDRAGFALSVSHSHSLWDNTPLFARLRARGLLYLLRFSAIACVGEARHFYTHGPGRPTSSADPRASQVCHISPTVAREPTLPWELLHKSWALITSKPAREMVYSNLFPRSVEELVELAEKAQEDLKPPGWSSGMGGESWAAAAGAVVKTWKKLQAFLSQPNGENWRRLGQAWNVLACAVHNGGKILNKWTHPDYYAMYPSLGFLSTAKIVVEEVKDLEKEEVVAAAPAPVPAPTPVLKSVPSMLFSDLPPFVTELTDFTITAGEAPQPPSPKLEKTDLEYIFQGEGETK